MTNIFLTKGRKAIIKITVYFILMLSILLGTGIKLINEKLSAKWEDFGFKILEIAIQLVTLTFIGGILMERYNRLQGYKLQCREFRMEILTKIKNEYREIKKVRQILKTNCSSQIPEKLTFFQMIPASNKNESVVLVKNQIFKITICTLPEEVYRRQMDILSDCQQKITNIINDIKDRPDAFEKHKSDKLIGLLNDMKNPIKNVLKEYRDISRKKNIYRGEIHINFLGKLLQFIGPGSETAYQTSCKANFLAGVQLLNQRS